MAKHSTNRDNKSEEDHKLAKREHSPKRNFALPILRRFRGRNTPVDPWESLKELVLALTESLADEGGTIELYAGTKTRGGTAQLGLKSTPLNVASVELTPRERVFEVKITRCSPTSEDFLR